MNDTTPAGHAQTVLLDPASSTRQEAVFVIKASGQAVLRGAIYLHVGATATLAAPSSWDPPNNPRYLANVGAYGLIDEVQIQDPQGQTLYFIRNAGRYASMELLKQSASTSLDLECERSFVRRNYLPLANGTFQHGANDFPIITNNTLTTPRACLDLRRIITMFRPGTTTTGGGAQGSGIPLASTGDLTITVRWQQHQSSILENPAQASNFAVDTPQLEYQLHRADLVSEAMSTSTMMFEEPISSSNKLLAADLSSYLPMGGGGMSVCRLLVSPVDQTNTVQPWAMALGGQATYQLLANGAELYPQPLNSGAMLAETYAAFKILNMPAGEYAGIAGGVVAGKENDSFLGFPVCPLPGLPGSPMNSTALDSSGLYLQIRRPGAAAEDMSMFAWLMRVKILSITPGGVQVVSGV